MKKLTALSAAALLAAGCADRGIVDIATQQTDQVNASLFGVPGSPGLTAMSWNVYYGTDPKIVLQAPSPDLIPVYAAQAWALLLQTNFPERAEALARVIAANKPDLVGLQEAALWRIQHTSDFNPADPTPNAQEVVYDFLALLTNALEARGLHYVVAVADTSTDIEVPMFVADPTPGHLEDIRLTDRDAVLIRQGISYNDAESGVYGAAIPIELVQGLPPIYIREGWSSVVATVGGRDYRFISTHLEIQDLPGVGDVVQLAQANELLGHFSSETLPTILVGDFNSDAASGDPSLTRSYDLITGAGGFTDSWARPFRTAPGLTCCQSDDLSNKLTKFYQRVDFIFTRNLPAVKHAGTLVVGRAVVGDRRVDRTPSGLWPSDHGGVVGTFLTPPFGPRWAAVAE